MLLLQLEHGRIDVPLVRQRARVAGDGHRPTLVEVDGSAAALRRRARGIDAASGHAVAAGARTPGGPSLTTSAKACSCNASDAARGRRAAGRRRSHALERAPGRDQLARGDGGTVRPPPAARPRRTELRQGRPSEHLLARRRAARVSPRAPRRSDAEELRCGIAIRFASCQPPTRLPASARGSLASYRSSRTQRTAAAAARSQTVSGQSKRSDPAPRCSPGDHWEGVVEPVIRPHANPVQSVWKLAPAKCSEGVSSRIWRPRRQLGERGHAPLVDEPIDQGRGGGVRLDDRAPEPRYAARAGAPGLELVSRNEALGRRNAPGGTLCRPQSPDMPADRGSLRPRRALARRAPPTKRHSETSSQTSR